MFAERSLNHAKRSLNHAERSLNVAGLQAEETREYQLRVLEQMLAGLADVRALVAREGGDPARVYRLMCAAVFDIRQALTHISMLINPGYMSPGLDTVLCRLWHLVDRTQSARMMEEFRALQQSVLRQPSAYSDVHSSMVNLE